MVLLVLDDEGVVVELEGVDDELDELGELGEPEELEELEDDGLVFGVHRVVGGHKEALQGFGSGAFQLGGGTKNTCVMAGPHPGCQRTFGCAANTFNLMWVWPVVVGCVPLMNQAP